MVKVGAAAILFYLIGIFSGLGYLLIRCDIEGQFFVVDLDEWTLP